MEPNTGYIKDSFDPRDVFLSELNVGGVDTNIPERYLVHGLKFEAQGSFPFCASFATTKMVEYALAKQGIVAELSKPHLFFNSGGWKTGSTFRGNLETARTNGCIEEVKYPMPENVYDYDDAVFENMRKVAFNIPFENSVKVLGYARLNPTPDEIKTAILKHGLVLAGVYAGGGYWNPETKRQSQTDNHAVLIVGWDATHWVLFDSLQREKGFDGYHTVSSAYTFQNAYVVLQMPSDWKQQRDKARELPKGNAECYGKRRDLGAEQEFAGKMVKAFRELADEKTFAAAGMFWELFIRAGVYGGYNLEYTKFFRRYAGDLINDCVYFQRTGKHVFDFNKPRDQQ